MTQSNVNNIRISAKAIILHQNRILLIRYKSDSDEWYTLPGGGQKFSEPLSQTLIRECFEESGYHINPQNILFVRDYIGGNHEFSEFDADVHQVEIMFLASLSDKDSVFHDIEINSDRNQVGAQWINLEIVESIPLFPAVIRPLIAKRLFTPGTPIYLGDVN